MDRVTVYEAVDLSSILSTPVLARRGQTMQVQQTTYGSLHHRTRNRFPILSDDTKVFVARRGNRIAGTAYVTHQNRSYSVRSISCTVDAIDETTRTTLITQAREATRSLKRRFTIN